jgi:hypothetical protein
MAAISNNYQKVPESELYHVWLDRILNNHNLQGKETASLMSYRMEKEHKLYSNHPQPCNEDKNKMIQLHMKNNSH